MNKIVIAFLGIALGAFAFFYRSSQEEFHSSVKQSLAAKKSYEGLVIPEVDKAAGKSSQPSPGRAASEVPQIQVKAISNEKEFLALLDETDLSRTITITQATQRLRTLTPEQTVHYFHDALVELGQKDNDRRERLVYLANEMQTDALLPFWKDLLSRKVPRFEDETKFASFGEPTEEMQSIHLELLNSIRNIGLIANRDKSAVQSLSAVITAPSSVFHDDFIRERAYISLREADLTAALRVLKGLDVNDGLRPRLQVSQ